MVGPDGGVKTTASSVEQVWHLLNNFVQHRSPSAGTAKELALRMAHLAGMVRDVTRETFKQEAESGTLHGQYEA